MIIFQKAHFLDAERISSLVNSAYRGEYSKLGWTTEADLLGGQRTDPDTIRNIISDPKSQIELALENNEILGLMEIKKEIEYIYFGMLTVNPVLQNKGIGKILLIRLEELARNWSYKKIRMTVLSQRTELIEFYERRGFKFTGETEPFPEDDPRFGLPKTKLIFNVFEKKLV